MLFCAVNAQDFKAYQFYDKKGREIKPEKVAKELAGDEITEAFNKVTEPINDLAQKIANISASLDVYDKNGQLINTANPEKVVLKKMENAGELIPEKDMEISDMVYRRYSWKRIQKELEKCVVMCEKCQRGIHEPNNPVHIEYIVEPILA